MVVLRTIREAVRTKSMFDLEHRVRRTDGTLGWTYSRAVPLLNVDGEIEEWFGAASDVTARKEAEENFRKTSQNTMTQATEKKRRTILRQHAALLEKEGKSEAAQRLLEEARK